MKETNTRVISELKEQKKTMEGLETKVLTTSEEVESKEAIIDILKKDIAEKEAKIGELVEAKTALNIELQDQNKVIDATTARLHTATQEIETKENAIDFLKKEIAEKEGKIGALVEAKAALNIELEDQKKVIDATTTRLHTATQEIETKENAIDILKKDIAEKEATIGELVEAKTALNIELEDQNKAIDATTTRLHTATQEIETMENAIYILKKEIAEKEGKIGELVEAKVALNIELEDQKKVIDATTTRLHCATQETETKEKRSTF